MPRFAGGAVRGRCSLRYGVAGSRPLVSQSLFLKMRCQQAGAFLITREMGDGIDRHALLVWWINIFVTPVFSGLFGRRTRGYEGFQSSAPPVPNPDNVSCERLEVLSLAVIVSRPRVFTEGGADVQGNVRSPLEAKHESLQ
ncbi:predicted protein [Histoplasma capsulatum var. duboisii H88]|uniref:Predicted protein n=1 Tax=Ajellomyces capsulatus (strain H88) TaxID=544711 RepID=F0U9P2_AJEC8|nr:predicted protein [Histoplasma capsulatum var. duboisii H88]